MKSFRLSQRTKAILVISFLAVGIGVISKKFISYPTGDCMKRLQEIKLNKEVKTIFILRRIYISAHLN